MKKELIQEKFLAFHPKATFNVISKGRVMSIAFDEVIHVRKFGYETIIYILTTESIEQSTV